jgi:hypothetical protein
LDTPHRKHPSDRQHLAASIAVQSLELILGAVRLTAFAAFRLAEPVVRVALTTLGLLSILMAFFYRLASSPPRSPFWLLLGFGLLCGLARLLYEQLMGFLWKGLAAGRR